MAKKKYKMIKKSSGVKLKSYAKVYKKKKKIKKKDPKTLKPRKKPSPTQETSAMLRWHGVKRLKEQNKKKKKKMKKDSPEMGNEPKDGVIYQGRYKEILPKTGVNQPETVRNRMKKKKY